MTFVFQPLLGFWLAASVVGLAFAVCPHYDWLPLPAKAIGISKNLLLTAGGLLHLRISLKFLRENIRRYDAMHSLFHAADIRVEGALKQLQSQIHATPPDAAAEQTIRDIQSMLIGLGKEALAENAEWLLMHRNRPVEPVLAGA